MEPSVVNRQAVPRENQLASWYNSTDNYRRWKAGEAAQKGCSGRLTVRGGSVTCDSQLHSAWSLTVVSRLRHWEALPPAREVGRPSHTRTAVEIRSGGSLRYQGSSCFFCAWKLQPLRYPSPLPVDVARQAQEASEHQEPGAGFGDSRRFYKPNHLS